MLRESRGIIHTVTSLRGRAPGCTMSTRLCHDFVENTPSNESSQEGPRSRASHRRSCRPRHRPIPPHRSEQSVGHKQKADRSVLASWLARATRSVPDATGALGGVGQFRLSAISTLGARRVCATWLGSPSRFVSGGLPRAGLALAGVGPRVLRGAAWQRSLFRRVPSFRSGRSVRPRRGPMLWHGSRGLLWCRR